MLDRLRRHRLLLPGLCALTLACDAFPKFQFQLQRDIQHQFHLTGAMVMVIDTTSMVIAIFDDARVASQPKELAAFQADVAQYAVTRYTRTRLKTVGVVVDRASQRNSGGNGTQAEPTVFVPEYHPDGTVRLAVMPKRRSITAEVRQKP
jgi:hypothetical protein